MKVAFLSPSRAETLIDNQRGQIAVDCGALGRVVAIEHLCWICWFCWLFAERLQQTAEKNMVIFFSLEVGVGESLEVTDTRRQTGVGIVKQGAPIACARVSTVFVGHGTTPCEKSETSETLNGGVSSSPKKKQKTHTQKRGDTAVYEYQ